MSENSKIEWTDQAMEQGIQAKVLTAPRIMSADVEANIIKELFFTADDGLMGAFAAGKDVPSCTTEHTLLTFCILTLRNGFAVTGESACASPENFDAEIGRKIARQNAVAKIWPLMGYALKSRINERAAQVPKQA